MKEYTDALNNEDDERTCRLREREERYQQRLKDRLNSESIRAQDYEKRLREREERVKIIRKQESINNGNWQVLYQMVNKIRSVFR